MGLTLKGLKKNHEKRISANYETKIKQFSRLKFHEITERCISPGNLSLCYLYLGGRKIFVMAVQVQYQIKRWDPELK